MTWLNGYVCFVILKADGVDCFLYDLGQSVLISGIRIIYKDKFIGMLNLISYNVLSPAIPKTEPLMITYVGHALDKSESSVAQWCSAFLEMDSFLSYARDIYSSLSNASDPLYGHERTNC